MASGSDKNLTSWWALTCALLDRFAASGARTAPNAHPDSRFDAWVQVQHAAEALLARHDRHAPAPPPELAAALAALPEAHPEPADAAHAVATVLDERFARTFPDDWTAELGAEATPLADGALHPVLASPWSIFRPFLSQPASMTDPAVDELPHVRRFRPTAKQRAKVARVDVHPVATLLRDALAPLEHVATGHPNVTWDELRWPAGTRIWPVTVVAAEAQEAACREIVAEALRAGCGVVVLPELSATERTSALLQALLDDHYEETGEAALVVAGSRHVEEPDGSRRNRAETLVAGAVERLVHDKAVPFRERHATEGISPEPTLHLYQDGPFRFAVAICKDVLDADVRGLLGDLGVNVLAIPAMSEKTGNFPLAAAELLSRAQSLSVLANGPLRTRDGVPLPHCSTTARPSAEDTIRTWPMPTARPDAPAWVLHPLTSGEPAARSLTGR